MTNWAHIQHRLDHGRGKAGKHVGQPTQIFKIGLDPTATNILDPGNMVKYCKPKHFIFRKIPSKSNDVEQANFDNITYEMVGDVRDMQPGDFILQVDPLYDDNTVFVLAQKRPVHKNIGVRCERIIKIYRPVTLGASPYAQLQKSTALPLQMFGSQFFFGTAGSTPTLVPAGFQTRERVFLEIDRILPSSTKITHYFVYIPELPGVEIQEGDWIVEQFLVSATPGSLDGVGDPNAGPGAASQVAFQFGALPTGVVAREVYYLVHHPFHQPFGMVGTQCVAEKVDLP